MEASKEVFLDDDKVIRRSISFNSQDEEIKGWLYLPADRVDVESPGIVSANALTAVKEITLPGYAERFAAAGFACLVFDYRFWGESSGEPRNQVIPYEMQQDIKNAITWLAKQGEVDDKRLGGWGVSLGGAHMLYLSTFEPRLKAVVATATSLSGVATSMAMAGKEGMQQMIAQLTQDRVMRYETGSSATYKTAWGKFGEDVLLPVEEALEFYTNAKNTIAPNFENKITVQSMENLNEYNPDFAINLASPTAILIIHAEKDVIPVDLVREVFERAELPKKMVVLDCLHTDLYDKEPWISKSSDEAINWFRKYLVQ